MMTNQIQQDSIYWVSFVGLAGSFTLKPIVFKADSSLVREVGEMSVVFQYNKTEYSQN